MKGDVLYLHLWDDTTPIEEVLRGIDDLVRQGKVVYLCIADPSVTATMLGARTLAQLEDNLGALNVALSQQHIAHLEQAGAIELGFPHDLQRRPADWQHHGRDPDELGSAP